MGESWREVESWKRAENGREVERQVIRCLCNTNILSIYAVWTITEILGPSWYVV